MYVDASVIIQASALLAAVIALGAAAYSVVKWFQRQEKQTEDIKDLNAEMFVMSNALLACLEGLEQLGADGKVSKAHDDLEKHLNQKAHGQK